MSKVITKTCQHLARQNLGRPAASSRSTSGRFNSPGKVGHRLPNVTLYENTPPEKVNVQELFKGKKGILFSVVGAFTPGCSQAHIPEYMNNYEKFKEEGYDVIACVSVNDPFVMTAWGKDVNVEGKIRLLADPKSEFTNQLGMELDTSSMLGNKRSKRYCMLIDDGVVTHVNMDPDTSGLACLLCIRTMR